MVFKEQLNAHIRFTLKVKVKVIKGHVPDLELCESSSLPNVHRAALAVNRVDEAWVNRQTFGKTLNRKPTLYYVRYFPTPITQSIIIQCAPYRTYYTLEICKKIPISHIVLVLLPKFHL